MTDTTPIETNSRTGDTGEGEGVAAAPPLSHPTGRAQEVSGKAGIANAKHTPGPWVYRNREHDDWGIVRSDDYGFICQAKDPRNTWNEEALNAHRRAKTDPREANARLISAAPELLAALKGLVAKSTDTTGDWSAAWRDALNAIAKAER